MTKIVKIIINDCVGCNHFDRFRHDKKYSGYCCVSKKKIPHKKIQNIDEIPDWCSLEESN